MKIDYKQLAEAYRDQRNALADENAVLKAALKVRSATWKHDCEAEKSTIEVAKGEACNWCGKVE